MLLQVFDFDTEMAKLSKTCLSSEDHEQIWNNTLKHNIVRVLNEILFYESLEMISQTEMRATLNFAPPRSWENYFSKEITESELTSAANIEAYYDLVEPQFGINPHNSFSFEKSMIPAIAFLDTRFPFIRAYYRRSFEEIRDEGLMNREVVDRMIHKFKEVFHKLRKAMSPVFNNYSGKC
ncbi:unnamed protein product [Auanema sp. JU1783]|nr:unnamed protein product [Auanema sp. JU1783]